MAALSAVEWDIIEARVQSAMAAHSVSTSLGFLYLVLEQFFPGRATDFPDMVTDGGNDLGIDAIEVIEREERAEVLLFQSKHRTSSKSTDRTINDGDVLKIGAFLHALFDKAERLLNTGNLQMTEAVRRIWGLHERGVVCRYRVVLCTNGQGLSQSAKTLIDSTVEGLHSVDYEIYGPAEIIRDIGIG